MYNLFNNFQIITYNGVPIRNILTKVKFDDLVQSIGGVFYPYVITEGERPDNIAYNYYDDPRYSWVIYMCNNITDPYHEWPLSNGELNEHIKLKYGSLENAQRTILFWKNNWEDDDTVKDAANYNALAANIKPYFRPVAGYNNEIINYIRAEKEQFVETNRIIDVVVGDTTKFAIGDLVTQTTSGTLSASGQVKGITDSSIAVCNIIGTFAVTALTVSNILTNRNTSSPATAITTISNPIPVSEIMYWESVDAYTYEFTLNESKRSIKLIDKDFIDQIEKELTSIL